MKDAAICSLDNAGWFVVTEGSNISQAELAQIVASIGNVDHLAATGIKVGGEKFVFVSGDESTIRGRKKGTVVHCKKTETTLIVGIYDGTIQLPQAADVIEKMANYLIRNHF